MFSDLSNYTMEPLRAVSGAIFGSKVFAENVLTTYGN